MGIVSIVDTKGSRSGNWSAKSGRSYHLELLIETDDPTMGARAIMRGLTCLRVGDFYRFPLTSAAVEWDYGSFVHTIDVKETSEDGKQWRVSLDYGPFDLVAQGGATSEAAADGMFDPFAVPMKVRYASAKFERACIKDALGNPIVNTAGDPFDPPLKRDDSRPILTLVRNEPQYNASYAQVFKDHVNADVFLGYEPMTVKCHDITAEQEYHADYGYYWVVTYEFELREIITDAAGNLIAAGWYEEVLNAGLRQLDLSGNPQHILINGAPVTSPVLLTQQGRYVGAATQPHYLKFQLYPTADFDRLNIPLTLLTLKSIIPTDRLDSFP